MNKLSLIEMINELMVIAPEEALISIEYLIKKYGLETKNDRARIFRWFHDLKLSEIGIKFFSIKKSDCLDYDTNTIEGEKLFYLMSYLNLRGAGDFALSVAKKMKVHTADEYRLLGGIHFTNLYFEESIPYFEKALELYIKKDIVIPYGFFNLVNALIYTHQFERAHHYLEFMKNNKKITQRNKWHREQMAVIELYKGNFEKCYQMLKECERICNMTETEGEDRSTAYIDSFIFITAVKTKRMKEAKRYYIRIYRDYCDQIQSSWVTVGELFYILSMVKDEFSIPNGNYNFLKLHPRANEQTNSLIPDLGNFPDDIGNEKSARIKIYQGINEYSISGKLHYGIPLDLKLISLVMRSDWVGITVGRVLAHLWPDQPLSYLHLKERLIQLIRRIKIKLKIEIVQKGVVLTLAHHSKKEIYVNICQKRCLSFFNDHIEFKRFDIEKHYSLSQSHSCNLISILLETGVIEKVGGGRNTFYRYKNSQDSEKSA
ncbi:MAG: hypothetical protein HOE90_17700 [Bacteriovoracaceae bacterium]|jgi:tetratricopeptide (TPR) repeat protein|nr:hypothetical protein [Bacteriovoracaceae bacterium]